MKQLIRQAQKIDTYNKWNGISNFVPLKGEIIVYQGGEGDYKNEPTRFKIGDGETSLNNLPFIIPEAVVMNEDGIQTSQVEAKSVNVQEKIAGPGLLISQNQAYIKDDPTNGELITRGDLNTWWVGDSEEGIIGAQDQVEWTNVLNKPAIRKGKSGTDSVVLNYLSSNESSANGALAGGYLSEAQGSASLAFGQKAKAVDNRSIALGQSVTAGSTRKDNTTAVAIGSYLTAYTGQHVYGTYNELIEESFSSNGSIFQPLYIIGAGTYSANKNAFIIDTQGNTHIMENLYLNGAISGAKFSDITLDNGLKDITFEPSITINDKQVNTLADWAIEYANSYKNIDDDLKEELRGTVDSYIVNQVW